jgi:hypothetical protein
LQIKEIEHFRRAFAFRSQLGSIGPKWPVLSSKADKKRTRLFQLIFVRFEMNGWTLGVSTVVGSVPVERDRCRRKKAGEAPEESDWPAEEVT